jgi:hypothetical protein
MLSEENKRLVRRYYDEVFTQRKLAALEELFAADFIGRSASGGGLHPGGDAPHHCTRI